MHEIRRAMFHSSIFVEHIQGECQVHVADPIWDTDVEKRSIYRAEDDIVVGVATKQALSSLDTARRTLFLGRVRRFYKATATKLMKYLPFTNSIIRSAQLLAPACQTSSQFMTWLHDATLALPGVIDPRDVDEILFKGRQYQLHPPSSTGSTADADIMSHWKEMTSTGNFPLLSKLVRALVIWPHGNADVERLFSNLSDIMTEKRRSLNPHTIAALAVIRSYMSSHHICCHSFPITPVLTQSMRNARVAWEQRSALQKKEEEDRQVKEREIFLQRELQRELNSSKALAKLTQVSMEVRYA